MALNRPIFLLTDFGAGSYYQGVMRGVIASIAPDVVVHDLGHGVQPGRVKEAAFMANASLDYLPEQAILVIVVDPGVGSDRRILAASFGSRLVLAPDNGVLGEMQGRGDVGPVRSVTNEKLFLQEISSTFHGRDIFAPVAARVAMGLPLEELGDEISQAKQLAGPEEKKATLLVEADVIHVDSFGNLITDVSRDRWIHEVGIPDFVIEAGRFEIQRISPTFSAVRPGEPVAYFGSSGFLEVGIRDGVAAKAMNVDVGDKLLVRKR